MTAHSSAKKVSPWPRTSSVVPATSAASANSLVETAAFPRPRMRSVSTHLRAAGCDWIYGPAEGALARCAGAIARSYCPTHPAGASRSRRSSHRTAIVSPIVASEPATPSGAADRQRGADLRARRDRRDHVQGHHHRQAEPHREDAPVRDERGEEDERRVGVALVDRGQEREQDERRRRQAEQEPALRRRPGDRADDHDLEQADRQVAEDARRERAEDRSAVGDESVPRDRGLEDPPRVPGPERQDREDLALVPPECLEVGSRPAVGNERQP